MMRSCNKCLENNWSYEHIEGWIRATCQMCGNEVEFEAKRKVIDTGSPCRDCNTPVIRKELSLNRKKAKKKYYFKAVLICPKCHKKYYKNEDKVYN